MKMRCRAMKCAARGESANARRNALRAMKMRCCAMKCATAQ
jgi:hypothetical protein